MRRISNVLHSLPAQMILSFVALAILTAAAAGLPALWLVGGELERQAWDQLDQGRRAVQALYAAQETEVASLAALAAGRPTLRQLVESGDQAALGDYLVALQADTPLDLVAVCPPEDAAASSVLAQAGALAADIEPCDWLSGTVQTAAAFYAVPGASAAQPWLASVQPVPGRGAGEPPLGQVVAALRLDDEFVAQMEARAGLEHSILIDGQPAATSLVAAERLPLAADLVAPRESFRLAGQPYYATRLPLGYPGLEAEVILPVANLAAARQRLGWTVAGTSVAVAAAGSVLGALLARRISRPLAHLAGAAAALSTGDLDRPISIEAHVREVALLAQALEGAREDLRQTLAELRQEKAWSDHLLEAIVEGIVTLDRQGRITFFSQGAERITGWQRDQVLGRPCDQVLQPVDTPEPFSQLIPAPGGRRKIAVELPDGRQAMLAVTGARLLPPEGGNARVALVFRDVSEEEVVHRLLGDFLANVAHEFRTPLSAVAASVELLLDQAPDLSREELQELLTSLHLGILGLQTLVDNLLESASIETGHFRVYARPCSLADIIADAIRTMQPLILKHAQQLVIELPAAMPVVHADPRRVAQVLVNLLSNAAKYGRDGGEVAIGAALLPGGQRVRISVADQGPGIPATERGGLFRRFAHPNAETDQARMGAGLGLSVVKAVVEAHGGQVGLDDRPGGGVVFWFTLPTASDQ